VTFTTSMSAKQNLRCVVVCNDSASSVKQTVAARVTELRD